MQSCTNMRKSIAKSSVHAHKQTHTVFRRCFRSCPNWNHFVPLYSKCRSCKVKCWTCCSQSVRLAPCLSIFCLPLCRPLLLSQPFSVCLIRNKKQCGSRSKLYLCSCNLKIKKKTLDTYTRWKVFIVFNIYCFWYMNALQQQLTADRSLPCFLFFLSCSFSAFCFLHICNFLWIKMHIVYS